MKELRLLEAPSVKKLNGAFSQNEGVILNTEGGLWFSFIPNGTHQEEIDDTIYPGSYCQIVDERFTRLKGRAKLAVSHITTPNPSARLLLLDRDEISQ